jgi:hypothetical protein
MQPRFQSLSCGAAVFLAFSTEEFNTDDVREFTIKKGDFRSGIGASDE